MDRGRSSVRQPLTAITILPENKMNTRPSTEPPRPPPPPPRAPRNESCPRFPIDYALTASHACQMLTIGSDPGRHWRPLFHIWKKRSLASSAVFADVDRTQGTAGVRLENVGGPTRLCNGENPLTAFEELMKGEPRYRPLVDIVASRKPDSDFIMPLDIQARNDFCPSTLSNHQEPLTDMPKRLRRSPRAAY